KQHAGLGQGDAKGGGVQRQQEIEHGVARQGEAERDRRAAGGPRRLAPRRAAAHIPRIEPVVARGSRRGQRPLSTWWKKSARVRLNRSGSSRLRAWPVLGKTTSAALLISRFISRPGSRHGSSSSPVAIRVGTSSRFISSVRSHSDGRRACTPRIV